jgi:hypothetical protein
VRLADGQFEQQVRPALFPPTLWSVHQRIIEVINYCIKNAKLNFSFSFVLCSFEEPRSYQQCFGSAS